MPNKELAIIPGIILAAVLAFACVVLSNMDTAKAAPVEPTGGSYTVITKAASSFGTDAVSEICYKGTVYIILNPYSNSQVMSPEFIDGHTVSCK